MFILRSLRLARDVVDQLPSSDHLHLLVNDSVQGLRYLYGPAAGEDGRQALLETLAKLKPGSMFLRSNLEQSGLPTLLGASGRTGVGAQEKNAYEAAGRLARAEYQATAVNLADDFETLATSLEQISAPKLLLMFSNGIERRFYFDGTYGFKPGSSPFHYYHVR